jgi:hypothetical protein
LRNLPHEVKSGRKTQYLAGPDLALAHHLVPWLEILPGVFGKTRRVKVFLSYQDIWKRFPQETVSFFY